MPRIYDSANEPLDFCWKHFPRTEEAAEAKYGDRGEGPDGRGNCFSYDSDHPPYEGLDYQCAVCGETLTEADDGPYHRG